MINVLAVLSNYPPDCQPASVEPLDSAGGMSGAQFWRIHAPRGEFALRRWPIEHPAPNRLGFIHAVLLHAAMNGCDFLPVPATTRNGETFIRHADHLWELTPWMPGIADYEMSPSVEKVRSAMHTLAKFHNAVTDFPESAAPGSAGGSNAIQRHLVRLRKLSPARISELAIAITDATGPQLAQLARQFLANLPRAFPQAMLQLEPLSNSQLRLQPCIRDIWSDHILFTGDEVTGVIDFGAVEIDTPATDVARLLGSLAQRHRTETWTEGLAAYNEVRPLSDVEFRAAYALETSGTILAGCNWIRWIYVEGRTFEDLDRIVERFRRVLNRCEQIGEPSGVKLFQA
jgi:Ser/Thr protein kinase RdoA (MazF antagonist)